MRRSRMSVPKAAGIETEYGIMIVGTDKPDPFLASDMLLHAYRQVGSPAVPSGSSYAAQAGLRRSSGELSLVRMKQYGQSITSQDSTDLMLSNGARFYIDHAHPEYSSPECLSPRSLVAADKAGEQIIADC